MKKLILFLIFIAIATISIAQDYQKIDSLKRVFSFVRPLDGTDTDTTRIKLSIEIGDHFEQFIPDSAIWWYTSVVDTTMSSKEILQNRVRSKLIANALYYTGFSKWAGSNFSEVIRFWKHALKVYEVLDEKERAAKCQLNLGIIYQNLSDISQAINFYEQSLKLYAGISDSLGMNECLNNLGAAVGDQGNYSLQLNFYSQGLKIAEEIGDVALQAKGLNNLGVVAYETSNYPLALSYFERSLKIAEEQNDKSIISSCLNNLGVIAQKQGDYPLAKSYNNQSLRIAEELNDTRGIAQSYTNLGALDYFQGNYSSAIKFWEKAMQINQEIKDDISEGNCLNNLGAAATDQGNYKLAESYHNASLKLREKAGDKSGIAYSLNHLGIIAFLKNDFPTARSKFESSLKLFEELGEKDGISNCLNNLGNVARDIGDYPLAISYLEKSLQIAKEIGDKSSESRCLSNIGNVLVLQNNYKSAIQYYAKSISLAEKLNDKYKLATYYPRTANAFVKENENEKALSLLLKAKDISLALIKDNFTLLTEKEKELYLENIKGVFSDLNSFNMNFGSENDSLADICYNNELVLKGLLLKSTTAILNAVYSNLDPEVHNAYFLMKQFRSQISELQGSEAEDRDEQIAAIEDKANEQERIMVRHTSEFAVINKLFDYRWEDVQKALKPDEAAIEFVSFTKGDKNDTTVYAAIVVKQGMKHPQTVLMFEEKELKSILGKSTSTGFFYINSLYQENSQKIYELVWKPLETLLKGSAAVYYAPVGVLNKISFAALVVEPGVRLCDQYSLFQLSSTGKLLEKEDTSFPDTLRVALYGGIDYNSKNVEEEKWKYLPGTLVESKKVKEQLLKDNVSIISFTGKDAHEESLKELYSKGNKQPHILHIATHGFFFANPEQIYKEMQVESGDVVFRGSRGFGDWMFVRNKNPMMRSGLVFSEANRVWNEEWDRTDNEGVLTAYEVSNIVMGNTYLVVLSACETGLGDIKGSEGVYGLQRAFKMAGAKYIIMSLWQVPDKETVEFMETFYTKLLKKKDLRKAFVETQQTMRAKYDPYYWAAFVLVE